jgi:hypothetical protein
MRRQARSDDLADCVRGSQAHRRCSISNAASTAKAPKSVCRFARSRARRCWRLWRCASLIVAYLSYEIFEKGFLRLKRRFATGKEPALEHSLEVPPPAHR